MFDFKIGFLAKFCVIEGISEIMYMHTYYGSLFSTLTQEMAEVFLLPEVNPSVWEHVEYCPGQGPAICSGYKLNGHC